jgi:hypothetical protein
MKPQLPFNPNHKIDAKLTAAINSGPSTPMTSTNWDRIRSSGRRRAREPQEKLNYSGISADIA